MPSQSSFSARTNGSITSLQSLMGTHDHQRSNHRWQWTTTTTRGHVDGVDQMRQYYGLERESTAYLAIPGMVAYRHVHCQRLRNLVTGYTHSHGAASLPRAAAAPDSRSIIPLISHTRAARRPTEWAHAPTRPLSQAYSSPASVCSVQRECSWQTEDGSNVRVVWSASVH